MPPIRSQKLPAPIATPPPPPKPIAAPPPPPKPIAAPPPPPKPIAAPPPPPKLEAVAKPVVSSPPPITSPVAELHLEERNRIASKALALSLQKLNSHWSSIEEKLREMQIPRSLCVAYNHREVEPDHGPGISVSELLGVVRYRGEWRLCHANDNELDQQSEWKPIGECTLQERVDAADQIDSLRLEIIKAAEEAVSKVESAVAKLSSVLSKLQ